MNLFRLLMGVCVLWAASVQAVAAEKPVDADVLFERGTLYDGTGGPGVEGDVATLGLTDYAQGELGDIVFVELAEVGRSLSTGDVLTTVESVKSVSELYSSSNTMS